MGQTIWRPHFRQSDSGSDESRQAANPSYAALHLARSLQTAVTHPDAAVRAHAQRRADQWTSVLSGMYQGTLHVGSRTPVRGTPAWVTLEVVRGGFSTGKFCAAGELRAHEMAALSWLENATPADVRLRLNHHFLTEEGQVQLAEMLRTGKYRVNVPEEGALLVVTWLAQNHELALAHEILQEIVPFFSMLRFYPEPADTAIPAQTGVFVENVGALVDKFRKLKMPARLMRHREALEIRAPLHDRLITLFLETVKGEPPNLERDVQSNRVVVKDRVYPLIGGWPCQIYPPGWQERAQALLGEFQILTRGRKQSRRQGNGLYPQLFRFLRRCVNDPTRLRGIEVGRIRLLLALHIAKRGTPDSSTGISFAERRAHEASLPTLKQVAAAILPRFAPFPPEDGISDIEGATCPITTEEAADSPIPVNTPLPKAIVRKIERTRRAPVEELVKQGIIRSREVLAQLLPQLVGDVKANGIFDPVLRRSYSAIYQAFRRRRSLLLLNLEKQVQIEELPWIRVLQKVRQNDIGSEVVAQRALAGVAALNYGAFPQTVVPNKLLQELRALSQAAGLSLPLVEEVAADIFFGRFSRKFDEAARHAANLMTGTLYARYYAIDFGEVSRALAEPPQPPAERPRLGGSLGMAYLSAIQRGRAHEDSLSKLCKDRAVANQSERGSRVAINGTIIEQQQILTTQNLAVLFGALDLQKGLGSRLGEMARTCFTWICKTMQMKTDRHHARLIAVKNSAYAWRQMIFYLSFLPPEEVEGFLTWAAEHLNKQSPAFEERFLPVMHGLAATAQGRALESEPGAKRFLGWTTGPHFLLPQTERPAFDFDDIEDE